MLRRFIDGDGVRQASSHRLVDEHGLACLEDWQHLVEMRPAVVRLQQDEIHLLQQIVDGVDDDDAMLFHFVRVARNTAH